MNRAKHIFDTIAEEYDHWYETPEGEAILGAELKCLGSLRGQGRGRWLEIGVGTGRFADSLGIASGIDPSKSMIEIAAGRGIETCVARAENLPFHGGSYDGVLMALAFCFIVNIRQALQECRRVLCPNGLLLIGTVPADSNWGREYLGKASRKHPVYSLAHFRTAEETAEQVRSAGFELISASSTLFWNPDEKFEQSPRVEKGIVPEAGFLGLLFRPVAP